MNIRRTEVGILDLLVAVLILTSVAMLTQLVLGVFSPIRALLIGVVLTVALSLTFVNQAVFPVPRNFIIVLTLGLLALLPRLDPFLYVWGGQDQGVYVAMSSQFARTGKIPVFDEAREQLSPDSKLFYDKLNHYNPHDVVQGQYEGEHEPGIYIKDLSKSEYVFQFFPLHPQWMALFADLFGESNRVYSLVCFSLLSILMLSLIAYELAGKKFGAGIIVATLLAFNPMHVFLARFPVSESISVFFSASAFYYLLRYFKSRDENQVRVLFLWLSSGAWFCLFLNHIAGFMYSPILAFIVLAGALSAKERMQMRHLQLYVLGVVGCYAASVWYGFSYSFPYSHDVFISIFGAQVGGWYVEHWKSVILLAFVSSFVICEVAWLFRVQANIAWRRFKLSQVFAWLLSIAIIAIFAYGIREAYWLGFTDHFKGDAYSDTLYKLSHSGWNGFVHSSMVGLIIYLSPFVWFFVVFALLAKVRSLDIYLLTLLLFIAIFLVIRTGLESVTYYYYYGRYLCGELLPFIIVLAGLFFYVIITAGKFRAKLLSVVMLVFSLLWETSALQLQYRGGEMNELDKSFRPLVNQVTHRDLLVLALNPNIYFPLRTTLDYYYGENTMFVSPDKLNESLLSISGLGHWDAIYVLSAARNVESAAYIKSVRLKWASYSRGHNDILPHGNSMSDGLVFLYRMDYKKIIELREGGEIDFGYGGNSSNYLGYGWSGQEAEMRWTDGALATVTLPFGSTKEISIRVVVSSFNSAIANVLVNGELRTHWKFDGSQYSDRVLKLNKNDIKDGIVALTFSIPNAVSPHEINPANGDTRKLGLSIKKIYVERCAVIQH